MENRNLPSAIVIGIVGFVLLTLFGSSMFLTVDPGEKGVLFKRFGGGLDKETIYGQGFHIIAPWNDMHVYNVKIQENYEAMEVLSKNGLSIKIDLSFRYNAIESQIGHLHDNIGKTYVNSIVKPEIRSVTREVIGNYLPEELYSSKREAIEDEIYAQTKARIESKYINLDAILIRDVTLPLTLQTAIEQKLKQEQQLQIKILKILWKKKAIKVKGVEKVNLNL